MTVLLDATPPPAGAVALPAGFVATTARTRLDSIDLLRGLVMVVMALDHTRDFFGAGGANPRDVAEPALFLTRWVTHFCAPIFIFLSGISAWLYGARGRSRGELSWFLFSRGLWLILIEFTLVRFGWRFSFTFDVFVAQVIWAIGASMVVLAALVHLPRWAIATVALAMIAGHNLLDGVDADGLGRFAFVWNVLHERGTQEWGGVRLGVLYPLVPWIGVMAAGFTLGPLFRRDAGERQQRLFWLGAAVTIGFVIIRTTNLYGDPGTWSVEDSALETVLSFINVEKYPPSLLYLMMTLGPGLMLLAAFERARGRLADIITTYGRVPFLYYVAHLYLIHALALAAVWWMAGNPTRPVGVSLGWVYAVWILVVVALYPLCRWFAAVKRTTRARWLSYL